MSTTICDKCGRVLQKDGKQIHSATFDSAIPHKHKNDYEKGIIYAYCDWCYEAETTPKEARLPSDKE